MVRISHTWREAMAQAGLDSETVPNGILTDFPGFDRYQAGDIDLQTYLQQLGKYLGGLNTAKAMQVHRSILIEPYAGMLEVVKDLHDLNIKTGCLSNTNEPHWEEMRLSGRFPAIAALQIAVLSHEVCLEKPQPQIYERFCEKAFVNPAEVLFFDDSPKNVRGALAAGWHADLVDPLREIEPQVRESLRECGIPLSSHDSP